MLLAFLPTENFLGSFKNNPYNFANFFSDGTDSFKIANVTLTLNDTPVDGLDGQFKTQFIKNNILADNFNHNASDGITLKDFKDGYHFLLFDLTTALESNVNLISPVARSGLGRLSVTFDKSSTVELTILVLLEYASILEIDKHRNIHTKYGT